MPKTSKKTVKATEEKPKKEKEIGNNMIEEFNKRYSKDKPFVMPEIFKFPS